jgi:hypothetical protein
VDISGSTVLIEGNLPLVPKPLVTVSSSLPGYKIVVSVQKYQNTTTILLTSGVQLL